MEGKYRITVAKEKYGDNEELCYIPNDSNYIHTGDFVATDTGFEGVVQLVEDYLSMEEINEKSRRLNKPLSKIVKHWKYSDVVWEEEENDE